LNYDARNHELKKKPITSTERLRANEKLKKEANNLHKEIKGE